MLLRRRATLGDGVVQWGVQVCPIKLVSASHEPAERAQHVGLDGLVVIRHVVVVPGLVFLLAVTTESPRELLFVDHCVEEGCAVAYLLELRDWAAEIQRLLVGLGTPACGPTLGVQRQQRLDILIRAFNG